ncbi:MAG: DNA primase [Rickettsiales bacterium]|nr:DNA primase [Rickettsiales bacterium]
MIFPKDFPNKLRSSILTSEVVGKKVKLKLRGKEFSGLCPFHNEKSPSFTVNDQKGFYHCFGCAAHGDIISFVMNSEKMEYRDAVEKLATDFGIPIPKVKFDEVKENKLERDFLILEKICNFFERNLISKEGEGALKYLQKREISSDIIKKFRLGFAYNSYESLVNFLKSEGFTDEEISRTGVIGVNDKKKFYDKFRNRVIFPITDKSNRVIAFGGRTIGDDMPKYLNSSETEFFKKNQTLYNYFFARKAVFSKSYAVVVEGYMDVISLVNNGVENVVAGLGTALSEQHLKELFFATDKIVICLDGDAAGIRAAKRVSEIALPLINVKKNIVFAFLPNQLDPDEFVKEYGAKELEKVFTNAAPLSQSLFDFALSELGFSANDKITAENKAKVEANLFAKIDLIKDVTVKKYFSLFFKDSLFSLGRKSLKNQQNQVISIVSSVNKVAPKFENDAAKILAKNIISLIIKFPELANFRNHDFDIKEIQLTDEEMTGLKDQIIEIAASSENKVSDYILEQVLPILSKKDELDLKNMLASIRSISLEFAVNKLNILLLKDLLLQVDLQYKEALNKVDEIDTHQTTVTNQRIREIFDYKNSLEQKILSFEKEFI